MMKNAKRTQNANMAALAIPPKPRTAATMARMSNAINNPILSLLYNEILPYFHSSDEPE